MTPWWSGPDALLVGAAAAMGLAGAWHCALMCGPLCARASPWPFHVGRVAGYAAAGAAVSTLSSSAAQLVIRGGTGPMSGWLTVWAMAHAAVLGLGLWLLATGRQPLWLATIGQRRTDGAAVVRWAGRARAPMGWGLAGGLWVFLPCGLLQSALVVSALGSGAMAGAVSMSAFALASAPGLVGAPFILNWLRRRRAGPIWQERLTRGSGALLAAAAAWSLGYGLWIHVRDYC